MLDFVLGICAYGDITDGAFSCIERLRVETDYKYAIRLNSQDALIGRSRSRVCTWFLREHPSDVLIFIDTDITFTTNDIKKLLEAAKDGHEIIAGGYMLSDGTTLAIRPWQIPPIIDGEIHDIEYVSTGFMAITHEALDTIQTKLKLRLLHKRTEREVYPFFESGEDKSGRHDFYMSEDWDFCDKARKAGLTVYFHSGILLGHLKRICLRKAPRPEGENIKLKGGV